MSKDQRPAVGSRVKLKRDVERYPHFIAESWRLGRVVLNDDDMFSVLMDVKLPGAEEWDNEIQWNDDLLEDVNDDVEVVDHTPTAEFLLGMFARVNKDCKASSEQLVPLTDEEYYAEQIQNIFELTQDTSVRLAKEMAELTQWVVFEKEDA